MSFLLRSTWLAQTQMTESCPTPSWSIRWTVWCRALDLSPKMGAAFAGVLVSNECEFTPPLPMGITVHSCSDNVLQDGVLKFSSHRLASVTPIMSWRYSRRLHEALPQGRRVSLPLPIFLRPQPSRSSPRSNFRCSRLQPSWSTPRSNVRC